MTDNPRTPLDRAQPPVILVLAGYYPPAYLAGGPTRSIPRIVDRLGDEFAFRVITRDHDLGVATRLPGVVPDRWVEVEGARGLYLSGRRTLPGGVAAALRRTRHDALYLNSLFSLPFSLLPLLLRRLRLVPRRGLIMAPRGELDPSALRIKRGRKRAYLRLVRLLGLLDDAVWHAATDDEARAITREFGRRARALVARDIPGRAAAVADPPSKEAGSLDMVFLSRISPMKNLDFAISTLQGVHGDVRFSIYGPIEDEGYWAACRRLADALPANVTLDYRGIVEPDAIGAALAGHDLFFLPSRGESFGHAIVEALLAGRPVLISDQTPWRDLEARHAGWELPLSSPDRFVEVIERCAAMTAEELAVWSAGALELGREIADDPSLDGAYRSIFRAAVSRRDRTGPRPDARS